MAAALDLNCVHVNRYTTLRELHWNVCTHWKFSWTVSPFVSISILLLQEVLFPFPSVVPEEEVFSRIASTHERVYRFLGYSKARSKVTRDSQWALGISFSNLNCFEKYRSRQGMCVWWDASHLSKRILNIDWSSDHHHLFGQRMSTNPCLYGWMPDETILFGNSEFFCFFELGHCLALAY